MWLRTAKSWDQRHYKSENKDETHVREVRRIQSHDPFAKKPPKLSRFILGFVEGVRDHKSGNHKENVYPQPTVCATRLYDSRRKSRLGLRQMKPRHRQGGYSPKSIDGDDAIGL